MNITTVTFAEGTTYVTAKTNLWQWDYGQILRIQGLDLPEAYAVHFSNDPTHGSSSTEIGGPDGVQIPDAYLQTGKPVYAFIFLHTGEDDGETEYKITIYVNARPQPDGEAPTPEQQSVIDQLIAALNVGVEESEEAAAAAAQSAQGSAQSASDAAESAQAAAGSATSAESYAGQATTAAGLAQTAQAASEAARDAAQTAQTSAEASATAANGSASSAAGSATAAAGSASDASSSASAASASATTASTAATAAQTAQSAAEDAAEDAQQAAQQAHVEYEQLSGEVDDLSDEVSQQKSAIDDLTALTNRKAGMLVDSVSGAVASFVPDSTIPDLLGVSVAVEPVQDLHGQDSPWPAGGGKNKAKLSNFNLGNGQKNNVTYSDSGATVSATGTYGRQGWLIPVVQGQTYTLSLKGVSANDTGGGYQSRCYLADRDAVWGPSADGYISYFQFTTSLASYSYTFTAPSDVLFFGVYVTTTATDGSITVSDFQLELGSAATAYAPYSNECPISGWNSVEVNRAGENLLDDLDPDVVECYIDPTTKTIRTSNKNKSVIIPVKPNTSYFWAWNPVYIQGPPPADDSGYVLFDEYPTAGVTVGTQAAYYNTGVITTGPNTKYMALKISYIDRTDFQATLSASTLSVGSSAVAHEPYQGNRYTIALGQTVYGGTLDVTAGTLTVDMLEYKLLWSSGTQPSVGTTCTAKYLSISGDDIFLKSGNTQGKTISDTIPYLYNNNDTPHFYVSGYNQQLRSQALRVFLPNDTDPSTEIQFVMALATPITIQLDPVTIATIANQTNNVWSDAGDVDVTYAADIKAYIDRLNQPTEDDMIANTLIAANKYFTINNRLFLSTASIAAGAQIIPGTNCTETSLAAALNALNA